MSTDRHDSETSNHNKEEDCFTAHNAAADRAAKLAYELGVAHYLLKALLLGGIEAEAARNRALQWIDRNDPHLPPHLRGPQ